MPAASLFAQAEERRRNRYMQRRHAAEEHRQQSHRYADRNAEQRHQQYLGRSMEQRRQQCHRQQRRQQRSQQRRHQRCLQEHSPSIIGLEAAQEAAKLAYLKSETGNGSIRVCHANNLSQYWSGADPFDAERVPPVCLPSLLDVSEIASCHAAALATGRRVSLDVSEHLRGECYDYVFSQEHVACYLHRESGFASRCPALCERLVATMAAAYPGMPAPTTPLHIRCVELHTYTVGGALVTPGHRDNGSSRTLIVQLSAADAFDGGRFVTWNEGAPVVHEMAAGDGLLIDSERLHNVQPVTRGLRHSLVIELWVQPVNRFNRFS